MRKRNHSDFISWLETEQEVFVRIKVLDTFHEQCQNAIQIISRSINVTKREGQENKACPFYISPMNNGQDLVSKLSLKRCRSLH